MTDKDQIEELTKLIDEKAFEYCDNDGCIYSDKLAKILLLAGYRRIKPNIDFIVRAGEISSTIEKVRKETAKEILQMLFKEWHYRRDNHTLNESVTLSMLINKICLRYSVEVEE